MQDTENDDEFDRFGICMGPEEDRDNLPLHQPDHPFKTAVSNADLPSSKTVVSNADLSGMEVNDIHLGINLVYLGLSAFAGNACGNESSNIESLSTVEQVTIGEMNDCDIEQSLGYGCIRTERASVLCHPLFPSRMAAICSHLLL